MPGYCAGCLCLDHAGQAHEIRAGHCLLGKTDWDFADCVSGGRGCGHALASQTWIGHPRMPGVEIQFGDRVAGSHRGTSQGRSSLRLSPWRMHPLPLVKIRYEPRPMRDPRSEYVLPKAPCTPLLAPPRPACKARSPQQNPDINAMKRTPGTLAWWRPLSGS